MSDGHDGAEGDGVGEPHLVRLRIRMRAGAFDGATHPSTGRGGHCELPGQQCVREALDLHIAKICAESAAKVADNAKSLSDSAFRALVEAAGENEIVGPQDVESARLVADDLDLTELRQARFRYQ
ncbi:hypothetical protein [Nocardia sp. NPDC005825]|uniref:hypothetical protein n=1 Tax=Nocardia sp. NPDC005825 TaxID=3155452 RepID=UPI0033D0E001